LGFGQPTANHGVGKIPGDAAIKATDPGEEHPFALAQGPQIDPAMARQLLAQSCHGLLLGIQRHMDACQFHGIAAIAIAQLQ
jgi:hypothetical protein